MKFTKAMKRAQFYSTFADLGFTFEETETLRRAEMTLSRWSEHECNGYIQRDEESYCVCTQCGHKAYGDHAATCSCEKCGDPAPVRHIATGKPYAYNTYTGKRSHAVADREKGALARIAKLMQSHPGLIAYHQGDPRGCSLYIVRQSDVPTGEDIGAYYSRGFAVCF